MSTMDHHAILNGFAEVVRTHEWERLGEWVHDDATWEYPQSGERFRGLTNIRAQFENYPGLGPGTSRLREIVGGTEYALTPAYTLIALQGTGDRGTALVRVRYPDGSLWWVINLYELREGRIGDSRSYFAPDFEPPEWRAPYRDGEPVRPPEP